MKEKLRNLWNSIKKLYKKFIYRTEGNKAIFFSFIKIKVTIKLRANVFGYLFISIWLIGFVWLTAYPLFMSFYYSFNEVRLNADGTTLFTSVGFQHYGSVISTDLTFVYNIRDFVFSIFFSVPLIIIISLVIGMLLNQKIKGRTFFRAIFFLPVIISSGPVLNELIGQGAGTVPLIEQLGIIELLESSLPPIFAEPLVNLFSELIIIFWFSGVQIILFLAALQKTNKEIYEAAQIDGASPWESFWKITLPSLKGIIAVSAIYTIVSLSAISNNPVLLDIKSKMYGVDYSAGGFGYASAMVWIYSIIVLILIGIAALIIIRPKREEKDTYKRRVNPYGR